MSPQADELLRPPASARLCEAIYLEVASYLQKCFVVEPPACVPVEARAYGWQESMGTILLRGGIDQWAREFTHEFALHLRQRKLRGYFVAPLRDDQIPQDADPLENGLCVSVAARGPILSVMCYFGSAEFCALA